MKELRDDRDKPVIWELMLPRPATMDLRIEDLNILDALKMLAKQWHVNIIPSNEVNGSVTLDLKGVTYEQAMAAIVWATGYAYVKDGGTIYVGTAQQIEQRVESK